MDELDSYIRAASPRNPLLESGGDAADTNAAGGPRALAAGYPAITGPQLTQRAVQPSGSTCTASLRPHLAQKRGGSVAARRRRQRS
jgi:hypothetical protein